MTDAQEFAKVTIIIDTSESKTVLIAQKCAKPELDNVTPRDNYDLLQRSPFIESPQRIRFTFDTYRLDNGIFYTMSTDTTEEDVKQD